MQERYLSPQSIWFAKEVVRYTAVIKGANKEVSKLMASTGGKPQEAFAMLKKLHLIRKLPL